MTNIGSTSVNDVEQQDGEAVRYIGARWPYFQRLYESDINTII